MIDAAIMSTSFAFYYFTQDVHVVEYEGMPFGLLITYEKCIS